MIISADFRANINDVFDHVAWHVAFSTFTCGICLKIGFLIRVVCNRMTRLLLCLHSNRSEYFTDLIALIIFEWNVQYVWPFPLSVHRQFLSTAPFHEEEHYSNWSQFASSFMSAYSYPDGLLLSMAPPYSTLIQISNGREIPQHMLIQGSLMTLGNE